MEQPAKSGPEEDRPRAKPEPSKAEDASRPATKSSAYTAAPLSSRMLAVVIVVGVILPIVYLGWLAVEKSQDKNTTGDSFGALMALVVIASLLWSRLKFGLRVRTMTTEQIRGEVKQGQSESRRRLHLLRRSPLAMVGLIIVAFIVSLSVLAPVLYSLGVIEHWDPNKAENPTAQGYFQLLPPSTEAGAQYDLYVTQTHITGPLSGPVSGFGARTLGKGNVTVTGDFFIPLPGSAVVNVSDVKTSLDRVEILAPDTKVQAGGRMELQARAWDAQGRRLAASFEWKHEGSDAGLYPPQGDRTTLYARSSAAGSAVKVILTGRLWTNEPPKSAEASISVEAQMPAWALDRVLVWPNMTVGEVTDFVGNATQWKPKTLEARAFAANGTRIPGKLLQVNWEVLPGPHNASLRPDPNLPAWKANVTNTRRAAAGVPVDVRATVTLAATTVASDSHIQFSNRLDLDKVEITPSKIVAVRGEFVELRARAFDEIPPQSQVFHEVVDAIFSWKMNWEGGGLPGPTDWSSTGPALTERLDIQSPSPGGYNAQIDNRGVAGPYYLDADLVTLVWDEKNLTTIERSQTVVLCRPVEPTPCETFKAANMLGGGDPMGAGETRTYTFSLGADVKLVKVRLYGPGAALFGRDNVYGRDYLSVLVWGSQISLRISFIVVASSVLIGVVLGGLAGYLGGRVDELVMRITDVFLAIPGLILAMGVAAVLTRSLDNIMYALVIVSWPGYTRLIRAQALSVRESLFVEAARAVGVPEGRIIMRHVIPNCLSPVLVAATLDIGGIVLTAAALSFIGFGALPPTPEWGLLINEGTALVGTAWWLVTLPGIMIFIFVLGFNLFGDGLRDILDPKLRQ